MNISNIEIDWKNRKLTLGETRPRLGFVVSINGRKVKGIIMALEIVNTDHVVLDLVGFDQDLQPFPLPETLPPISYGVSDPSVAAIAVAADLRSVDVTPTAGGAGVEIVTVTVEGFAPASLELTVTKPVVVGPVLTSFGLVARTPEPQTPPA